MEQELLNRRKQKRRRTAGVLLVLAILAGFLVFGLRPGGSGQESGTGGAASAPAAGEPAVTLEITCRDLSEHMDRLTDEAVREYIPKDGEILAPEEVALEEGESVYDLLQRVCREKNIHLESSEDPVYQSRYVEGIGHLYEKDAGKRSGWTYEVDGTCPDYGCSKYMLKGGERVRWVYVTDYTEEGDG